MVKRNLMECIDLKNSKWTRSVWSINLLFDCLLSVHRLPVSCWIPQILNPQKPHWIHLKHEMYRPFKCAFSKKLVVTIKKPWNVQGTAWKAAAKNEQNAERIWAGAFQIHRYRPFAAQDQLGHKLPLRATVFSSHLLVQMLSINDYIIMPYRLAQLCFSGIHSGDSFRLSAVKVSRPPSLLATLPNAKQYMSKCLK